MCKVLYLLPFFFFFVIIYFIKVNIRQMTPLKKTKRGFHNKMFRSGLHVVIQIILLYGFDVCISIVRLNRK